MTKCQYNMLNKQVTVDILFGRIMQDRYAGDIGDSGKIGLLRALQKQGFKVGVNWYKTAPPDSEKKSDGTYKQQDGRYKTGDIPEELKKCDPALTQKLAKIAEDEAHRSIAALERAKLVPDAAYYHEPISVARRNEWHQKALQTLSGADLVFLDPDNGLLVDSVGPGSARSVKYAFYDEVADYIKAGKSVVIYNHRCRKPEEQYFADIENKLREALKDVKYYDIQAITFFKRSVRDYFIVSATKDYSKRIRTVIREMTSGAWGAMCREPKSN